MKDALSGLFLATETPLFKALSWYFGYVEKRHNLGKKQLQFTYCPISQETKAIIQWILVS